MSKIVEVDEESIDPENASNRYAGKIRSGDNVHSDGGT